MRWIAALLAAIASSACAPASEDAPAAARLSLLLAPAERPFWVPIAEAFTAAHPGVSVELVEGPQSTDLRESLYTAALLSRDDTFDLVYLDVTWTAKFAAAGWLRPLEFDWPEEERSRFLSAALDAGWYEGRLYRIPVRTDIGLVYYREDLLAANALSRPSTFAELEQVSRALAHPPDLWGFVWQGKQYEGLICFFLEVLTGHGGFWIDPETRTVGLDRPEAAEALRFLARARAAGGISPPGVASYQEDESRRLFTDGRAVFLRNWPYVWRIAQREDSAVRGQVGVMPPVATEGERRAGTLGGWGLGISTASKQPELALEFIRWMTRLESQRALCAPSGYAPALQEAYRDSSLRATNPLLETIEAAHAFAVRRPSIATYAQASDILQRYVSGAIAGTMDVEDALGDAARETRQVLAAEWGEAPPPGVRS